MIFAHLFNNNLDDTFFFIGTKQWRKRKKKRKRTSYRYKRENYLNIITNGCINIISPI